MNARKLISTVLAASLFAGGCTTVRSVSYNDRKPVEVTQISTSLQRMAGAAPIFYGSLPRAYTSADSPVEAVPIAPVATQIAGNFAFSNKAARDTLGVGWKVEEYLARTNKGDLEAHLKEQLGLNKDRVVVLDAPRITVTNMTKTREECDFWDDGEDGKFMILLGSVFTFGAFGAGVAINCANQPRIYKGEFTEQVTGKVYDLRPSPLHWNPWAGSTVRR